MKKNDEESKSELVPSIIVGILFGAGIYKIIEVVLMVIRR